jgi:hypothetical protein
MKITKILATASSVVSGLYLTSAAYAQSATSALEGIGGVAGDNTKLMSLINDLINWAIGIAALVCVVVLIASGYKYITAAGDENKIESATKTLTFAIIGLVVCFIAVILVRFVLGDLLKVS